MSSVRSRRHWRRSARSAPGAELEVLLDNPKAGSAHRHRDFWITRKGLPYEAAAQVLRHQDADAEVDAKHVRVVPVVGWMEGVAETVAAPRLRTVLGLQPDERLPRRSNQAWLYWCTKSGSLAPMYVRPSKVILGRDQALQTLGGTGCVGEPIASKGIIISSQ